MLNNNKIRFYVYSSVLFRIFAVLYPKSKIRGRGKIPPFSTYCSPFMLDSEVINLVYGDLVRTSSNPNYGFQELSGSWGFRNSPEYNTKKLHFTRSMRELAKVCSVRYHGGCYFIYMSGIYVRVKTELLVEAYSMMVEHLRIVPMIGQKDIVKDFLNQVKFYNPLIPRRDIVAFSNGVLDLTDYSFHDFSPSYHVTYKHPYRYEPTAKCPKWHSFLHEVLPDKNQRLILQMFLGLGLIERGTAFNAYEGREANKVELCLILIGSGSNGKSVVYNTAVGLFGSDRISSADYDELTAGGDEGMRSRTLMEDALFNWSSDSDSRTFGRKRTGVFKRIVSGEPITVRKIGENVREEARLPYLIFNLNELPYPDDQSLGFIRRLQFVSFDVTIPVERQNKALSYELVSEYSGIFNWVVRGCKEVKRRKFVFPTSEGNRKQVIQAQLSVNPVLAWVNSYNIRPEKKVRGEICEWIPSSVMLESLARFCDDNNAEMVSNTKFGWTMNKIGRGFAKRRRSRGVEYQVYGCTEEYIKHPFVLNDPDTDMHIDYVDEKGTYITDDD